MRRASSKPNTPSTSAGSGQPLSRRAFVKAGGALLVTLSAGGFAALASGCATGDAVIKGERKIIDDAGRQIAIPTAAKIERIYFTSGLASIFCFTLAPELIAGTPSAYEDEALEYLPERMAMLPVLGSLSGNGEIDRELLIGYDVQIVFSISAIGLTAVNISEAEELQEQTGIPVVLIDGSDLNLKNAYTTLGDILGLEKRAEELAGYCDEIYNFVTGVAASVPAEQRARFYYAEGPMGLQTEPSTSQHAIAFEAAGGYNVAQVETNNTTGLSDVSLEQVMVWNPDYIIALSYDAGGADEHIRQNPDWNMISAVEKEQVYTMPHIPFNWCDRPTAVNRYLGLHWLCYIFYPERYKERYDIVEEVKKFYSRFYWCELSDEEAIGFLGSSYKG